MTNRQKKLCDRIAYLLCYPMAFAVGGVEQKLCEIVKCMTANNASLKKHVMEVCKEYVEIGDFDSYAYETSDEKEVLKMMEEDYDSLFYK